MRFCIRNCGFFYLSMHRHLSTTQAYPERGNTDIGWSLGRVGSSFFKQQLCGGKNPLQKSLAKPNEMYSQKTFCGFLTEGSWGKIAREKGDKMCFPARKWPFWGIGDGVVIFHCYSQENMDPFPHSPSRPAFQFSLFPLQNF